MQSANEIKLNPNAIADWRKKNGFTQKEVSVVIGVPQSSYYYMESGKRFPDVDVLVKLSNIKCKYHFDIAEYLGLESNSKLYDIISDLENENRKLRNIVIKLELERSEDANNEEKS